MLENHSKYIFGLNNVDFLMGNVFNATVLSFSTATINNTDAMIVVCSSLCGNSMDSDAFNI